MAVAWGSAGGWGQTAPRARRPPRRWAAAGSAVPPPGIIFGRAPCVLFLAPRALELLVASA
eukprot:8048550-Lingulodinium_polyedra.AAC.1